MRMNKSEPCPSFFKVLLDFTRRLYGWALPASVELQIDGGRRSWEVKVEQIMDEDAQPYCFTRGWKRFAEDVALEIGEFLVFRQASRAVFDVHIFQISGCERRLPVVSQSDTESATILVVDHKGSRPGRTKKPGRPRKASSNPLYFEADLKEYQTSRVTLRANFVSAAHLHNQTTVRLQYHHRKEFQVIAKLDHRAKWRTDLAKGWSKFRISNHLVFGKKYSFQYKPRKNLILIKEVAKPAPAPEPEPEPAPAPS
ncbi:B3 domain-containing protein Os01g0905400-like isoform X2 [Andrographis paniculata]|uniref:B3 domain-containing protein Os01g0905400-like isoform X2 n=1 Tax=Andrographis paniculata TaxID=175694 RepID=UPI0021E72B7D|nr:B3 domain-containing protein Os01g0905400-like isoform X2 [Andrographis paniculata]